MPVKDFKLAENNPLVADGYALLECPVCDLLCYPDAKTLDGTIIYNRHKCKGNFDAYPISKRFEINDNGDIV